MDERVMIRRGVAVYLLFAWLQLRSRSVVAPTIAHASLNAIAGLPFLLLRGVDPAIAGVIYSPVGFIVLIVAIVIVKRKTYYETSVAITTSRSR